MEFWDAIRNGDLTVVSKLLQQTPALTNEQFHGDAWSPGEAPKSPGGEESPFTNTAIHTAAVTGNAELIRLLIENGADVNAIGYESNKGLTPPIVLAAWEGSLESVQVLLENGADPNLPASAETALYTAAEHKAPDKVALLLKHGARHDIFTAAICGEVDLVRNMLAAYPTLRDARSLKRNRTPAEEAAHFGQEKVVALFNDKNVD